MSERPEQKRTAGSPALIEPETVSPYLHDRGQFVYKPLTGKELQKDSLAYQVLSRIEQGLPPSADPASWRG